MSRLIPEVVLITQEADILYRLLKEEGDNQDGVHCEFIPCQQDCTDILHWLL